MAIAFDSSKLVANVDAIRARMSQDAVRKAVVAGAAVIQAAMIEATPVLVEKLAGSDSLEPGEIKAGIKVRSRAEGGEPVALVGPTGKGGVIAKTAHLVEYGHRMVVGGASVLGADGQFRGRNGKAAGKVLERDVPAYPFLRPAYEASAAAALAAVGETLGEQLKDGGGK